MIHLYIYSIFVLGWLVVFNLPSTARSFKPASHWPIIKESEGSQSMVRSDEICSDYFHRSFRSHCPTVGPNLTLAIENYLRSSDQSLTWQTTADYLRLLFPPDASSPTARFFIRFFIRPSDPPISRAMGRRLSAGPFTVPCKGREAR